MQKGQGRDSSQVEFKAADTGQPQAAQPKGLFAVVRKAQAKATYAGFTLIEVMLTLAISGIIFVGLVGGLSGSVSQQRYVSNVDSFAEFLRMAYSETSNPQSNTEEGGNSTTQAIYGRLILIGHDSSGSSFTGQFMTDYLVLGSVDAVNASRNFNLNSLSPAQVNELSQQLDLRVKSDVYREYTGTSGYRITDTTGRDADMAILVMRNLSGGSLRTYVYDCTREGSNYCMTKTGDNVSFHIGSGNNGTLINGHVETSGDYEGTPLTLNGFSEADANFCMVSADSSWAGGTRNIRLLEGGTNTGAVQIVEQDSTDNLCRGLN